MGPCQLSICSSGSPPVMRNRNSYSQVRGRVYKIRRSRQLAHGSLRKQDVCREDDSSFSAHLHLSLSVPKPHSS